MPPHALANPANPVLRLAIRPLPGFSKRLAAHSGKCIRGHFYQQLTNAFRGPGSLPAVAGIIAGPKLHSQSRRFWPGTRSSPAVAGSAARRRDECVLSATKNQRFTNVFRGPGRIIAGPKTLRSAAGRRDECVLSATKNQQLTNVSVSDNRRNPSTLFQLRTLVANLGRRRISRLCFTSAAPFTSLCLTLLTTFRFTRLSALRPQVGLESHACEKTRCFLRFALLRAANKALAARSGISNDSAGASGVGPPDHSQRKTFAESAVKMAKMIASAATSPRWADQGSPIHMPWSSETA